IVEVLFNTIYLSDVGCTFRIMSRSVVEQIQPNFERKGSAFGFEMMLHVISQRISFVQLPLNYNPRVGKSSVTGSRWKTFVLGMEMFSMCFTCRARRSRI
ncbi:MAG: glycosyltransferase family 2 protein, partial [Ilumatobacteraceae bacterium]